MSAEQVECYILPTEPLSLVLPVESVAEIVEKPVVEELSDGRAKWMHGHTNWRNQRLPVVSYGALHDTDLDVSTKRNPVLVVLNPIPDAARKAYSSLLCHGEIEKVMVTPEMPSANPPEGTDRRYIDAVVKISNKDYIIPKLDALGVALSYF